MTITDLSPWIALPVALLLVMGGMLSLIGSFGLLRLPDFYSRMHAPTPGNTMGIACVLAASILAGSAVEQRPMLHELLILGFMLATSPVTALLLMQVAIYRERETMDDNSVHSPANLLSLRQRAGDKDP